MLEEAVFGLPHEQKSVLVDAAQLKRLKKSHNTECTPVETEPVHMDQSTPVPEMSWPPVLNASKERKEKRKKERTIQRENKSR